MTDDDRRLREAFQRQRAAEHARAPGFPGVLEGRRVRRPRSLAVPALAVVVCAGLLVLGVSIQRTASRGADLELARQVMSWRSTTGFLLPAAVPGLAFPMSRIDEAPAGSPLKILDHGGALGPPITGRSPRS